MAYNWKILGQQCEAFQFQTFIFNIIVFLSLLLVCHMPGSNKTWTKTSTKIPSQNLKIMFIKKKILIELVFVLFCLRKWSFFFYFSINGCLIFLKFWRLTAIDLDCFFWSMKLAHCSQYIFFFELSSFSRKCDFYIKLYI